MSGNFARVIVADFEYEVRGGELPNVLCMVAYELDETLRHVRAVRKWRGGFDAQPPFDIGPDTLFVAYSAWAEMTCFMVLGWQFPVHIFDLHTAYLAASNVLRPQTGEDAAFRKPKKDLAAACRAYGIIGWEGLKKGHREGHRRGPLERSWHRADVRLLRRGRAHVRVAAGRGAARKVR